MTPSGRWGRLGLAAICLALTSVAERPRLDLTGPWDFYPDVGDAALTEITAPRQRITVPGAWQTQGYGSPGGVIPSSVIGSDLSPADYLRHNLTARCLYVREAEIPAAWQGRRIFLCVRRVYRYADVTVNGRRVGEHEGFCSPFEFDVSTAIRCGEKNQLVLGVDNRPRPGRDTVGTANYFGNWGGFGGAVYLEARPPMHIADVFAVPRLAESRVVLRVTLDAGDGPGRKGLRLEAEVTLTNSAEAAAVSSATPTGRADIPPAMLVSTVPAGEGAADGRAAPALDVPVDLPNARLWTPDTPALYAARVKLLQGAQLLDEVAVRFGMREISAEGRQLLLNGQPLYLSGYGDDATEPLTGMLPNDKALYRQRLQLMRRLGFNFVRHHSCTPHDEYFEAADEVGMLVQPEAGMAYVKYWPKALALFAKEWPQIVRAYRNHPSIWAWCMGNELFLNELTNRQEILEVVAAAYRQAKALDPTRLVHASDGGTPQEFSDVYSAGGAERYGPKPFLLHEYGGYTCSLPDFSLIPRLDGIIRPLTYERAERYVRERQLEAAYPRLRRSSLLMRAEAQKHFIEAAKARDGNNGFSFWLGIDFPDSPEGCWDEGILNQLWEPKPYLTNSLPDIAGPTVLLCDVGLADRSYFNDAEKPVGLRLWHYGSQPIQGARLSWRVTEAGAVLQQGARDGLACAPGERVPAAEVVLAPLPGTAPRFARLEVELEQGRQRLTGNHWDFYAYPRDTRQAALPGVYSEAGDLPGAPGLSTNAALPPDLRLLITRELRRPRHTALIERGHAAVLLLGTGGFKETRAGYFLNQYGSGFGGIIEDHPVLASIPHDGWLHPGLHQLIAGGGLLEAETMPAPWRDSAVVWGLKLTAWISPVKDLNKGLHWTEVVTDDELHLVLCSLDLLSERPESRYVLARLLDYLLAGKPSPLAQRAGLGDLNPLFK